MRLLVYGGTQYAERRRIGDWPASISAQFLQSPTGLSQMRAVYGVGVADESPFVIFRSMRMHERRTYPISVLLDPGALWHEFGWNGARLLWLLFDKAADKGSSLIKEPERFHSAQDLERLLGQVLKEDAPPPRPEGTEAEEAAEGFLHLWAGALPLEQPLTMGFGEGRLGLAERPSYAEMAHRFDRLPLPLRGALGWVMGGNESYAATFGVNLIFDDGKTGERQAEAGPLVERGRGWLSDWRAVEEQAARFEGTPLARALAVPLREWEQEQRPRFPNYTREDLLDDVRCVRALLPGAPETDGEGAPPDVRKRLSEVLDGRMRGPLNQIIEGLFQNRLSSSKGLLSPEGTRFVLQKLYGGAGSLSDLGVTDETHLQPEVAISYTVEGRTYPSEKDVPQFIRFEVLKRLLASELEAADVPRRLLSEVGHLPPLSVEQARELVEAAVERMARSSEGLSLWLPHADDRDFGPLIRGAAKKIAWRHVGRAEAAWQRDYLLFGDDPDGASLFERSPDLAMTVVREAIAVLKRDGRAGGPLAERARKWLSAAGHTELRPRMSLEDKTYLAGLGLETWSGLRDLRRAFDDPATVVQGQADPAEQKYLVGELRELSAAAAGGTEAPPLRAIVALFDLPEMIKADARIREAIDVLAELKPDMGGAHAEQWVLGWREIARKELLGPHAARYESKFQNEAARFVLSPGQSQKISSFKLKELAGGGEEDPLRELLGVLLFEGGPDYDRAYGKRLNDARAEFKNDETVQAALRGAFKRRAGDREKLTGMLRRLDSYKDARDAIKQALGDRERMQLDDAAKQFGDEKLAGYRRRVFAVFSGQQGGPHDADAFLSLAREVKADSSVFSLAVAQATEELLESEHADSFLKNFSQNTRTIKALKECLPPAIQDKLDEAIAEFSSRRLSEELERWLVETNTKPEVLVVMMAGPLKAGKNGTLKAAADAAMMRCIADEKKWKAVYEGRMLTNDRGVLRVKIDSTDEFTYFFKYLSPAVQQQVVYAALLYNKDRFYELLARAYDSKFGPQKWSEGNTFRDAVLAFLLTPGGAHAKEKFIVSEGKTSEKDRIKVDKNLSKLQPSLPQGAEAELRAEAPTPTVVTTPAEGLRGKVTKALDWLISGK